jgi:hypothetical protein
MIHQNKAFILRPLPEKCVDSECQSQRTDKIIKEIFENFLQNRVRSSPKDKITSAYLTV